MKNNISKLLSTLFLFAVLLVKALPVPPDGGTGGSGTGEPAAPIDMYVYVLSIIAVMFIVFYTKKYKSQKA
jgi:hypothetical protein